MIWFLLLGMLVVAIPLVIERNRAEMEDADRGSASGQFAELPGGVTHYEWIGPAQGPVAVCVHGLTTPSLAWRAVARGLASMGYRTLTYDLYGRGYSDRPSGPQDRQFFIKQLQDLLEDQDVTGSFTLLGYSMGGSIASCFAAAFPDRVERLILLAPAGMGLAHNKLVDFMAKTPVIGDWLMLVLFPPTFRRGIKAERDTPVQVPHIHDHQAEQLDYKHYVPAVLASRRGILADVLRDEHRAIQSFDIPVLAVWGDEDRVIPASAIGSLAEWNRTAEHEVIAGAGHGLPYTHAPQIVAAIWAHISATP